MRTVSNDSQPSVVASAITLEVGSGDGVVRLAGVIAGKILYVLCDQYPTQNWVAQNRSKLLAGVSTEMQPVTVLRIYADTHR